MTLERKFQNFIFFSRTTGPISTKLGTLHTWVKGIQACSNERLRLFPRGDNYETGIIHRWNVKILYSKTTVPISTKLCTNRTLVMKIQVSSNKGLRPFPKGDNYKKLKIHLRNLKIFFSRNTGPISTKLGTKHPWVMKIQVFLQMKGSALFREEIITKNWKYNDKIWCLLLQHHCANFN